MKTDQLSNETTLLDTHQPENQSDLFTKAAFAGEYLGVFSDAYWFANVLDLVVGKGEDALGLSYYGIAFGALLAITSAYGASSCQKILNTHLNKLNQAESAPERGYHSITIAQTTQKKDIHLSIKETVMLIANTIARASDVASGPMFVVKLASKNLLSKYILFAINIFALLLGVLCSIANTKSCYFAMLALKKMPELKNQTVEAARSDRATIDDQESEKLYTPKTLSLLSEQEVDERHDAAIIGSINDSTEQNVVPDKAVDKTQNGWGSYIFSMFPARLQSMVISKKEEPSVIPDDYMVV